MLPTKTPGRLPGMFCLPSLRLIKYLSRGCGEHFVCFASQVAQKVLKNAKMACSRLGQYRMPFAWAARWAKTLWKCSALLSVYCQSQYLMFLFFSTGLCLEMPQGLWIKALGSPRCTGKTVINSQRRIFSNCWRILGSQYSPQVISLVFTVMFLDPFTVVSIY